jgi:6-phosphogluconolactonase (cycloisomerase 2 family)
MTRNLLVAATLTAFLTACSGGGGGGGGTAAPLTAPQNLTYETGRALYIIGVDIQTNAPAVTGVVTDWSVAPALPTGLELDPATGVISGTGTSLSGFTRYTITAANSAGQTDFQVTLGMRRAPRFAYVTNEHDGTISIYTVDAHSGLLHFHSYQAPNATQDNTESVLLHSSGQYAFVTNHGPGGSSPAVGVYDVDPESGNLTLRSSLVSGVGPHDQALTPSGQFLYVTSKGSNEITAYEVTPNGDMTQIGTPITTENGPVSVTIDPLGRFVYVVNQTASSISIFRIGATGALAQSTSSVPVTVGTPLEVQVDTTGEHAWVSIENSGSLQSYEIDPISGTLVSLPEMVNGIAPTSLALHPTDQFVYVTDDIAEKVSIFEVDRETAELTLVSEVTTGDNPQDIVFDASGNYAYVLNRGSNDISMFSVNANTGVLVELGAIRTRGTPLSIDFTRGEDPIDYAAPFLYSVNTESNDLTTFSVDASTGSLTQVGLPAYVGSGPRDAAFDPRSKYLYVADTDGGVITVLQSNPSNGVLSFASDVELVAGRPRGIAVDPSGRFVYTAVRDLDLLLTFAVDPFDGSLTQISSHVAGKNPHSVDMDPTGRFIYVTNAFESEIAVYEVLNGLVVAGPFNTPAPTRPVGMSFSPLGDVAYVPLNDSNIVVPYIVDPFVGILTPIPPGSGTAANPNAVAVHPNGQWAYAAVGGGTGDTGHVSSFVRDGIHLTQQVEHIGGPKPQDIVIDPTGTFLYSANVVGDDLSVFRISQNTGRLTYVSQTAAGLQPVALVFMRRAQ